MGGKITPLPLCLKLVRITLETSNLVRKYTPLCSFRKYTFYCLGLLNFADVSISLQKNSVFIRKSTLLKVEIRDFVRDFSVLFSVFVRKKVTTTENITFADSVSEVRPMGCSKLAKNPINDNDVTIF